jgi:hypothetical protein
VKADREFESRPHRQKIMENKIVWTAREFSVHKKTALWYICFFIIVAALIAYAVYIRDILTIITFGLLAVVALIFSHQKPKEINYELNSVNAIAGQTTYPYRNIKKFWIIYSPKNRTLNFETTAYINSHISLQLGNQDPTVVKQFLKNYLKEDIDQEENFTDVLSRKIKF